MGPVGRRTLIILDDSDSSRELVEHALGRRGWRVVALASPFQLASVMNAERPDVVLVDVEMPALHGDKVIEVVNRHQHLHRCPLVLYSGLPDAELEELAKKSGAAGYIRKDVAGRELAKAVEGFIRAAQAS
jgi:PleD family two-component response regulator